MGGGGEGWQNISYLTHAHTYLNCIYGRCTCDGVKQYFLVVVVIGFKLLWLLHYIIYLKCFLLKFKVFLSDICSMPGTGPKSYPCVLCNKRTTPNDRYKIKSQHATIIEKKFLQKTTNEDVLCRKCRYICETQSFATQESKSDTSGPSEPCKRMKTSGCASPPSITLSIPSTSKSHANCVICKKPGPKLIVVTQYARVRAFIRKEMFVPAGSRCCPKHIADNEFTVDALQKMQQTNPDTNINRTATVELLQQTRDFAIRNENTRLNFDNPNSMDNEDYYNLTGLTKDQFEELLSYLKDVDIRASKTRSARTCIAILLTKLRCGMSNHLLGTLFGLQKWQVSSFT